MRRINPEGRVAINCLPTAAHTICGAVAGRLLLSPRSSREKLRWLVATGLAALAVGHGMDWTVTPTIFFKV